MSATYLVNQYIEFRSMPPINSESSSKDLELELEVFTFGNTNSTLGNAASRVERLLAGGGGGVDGHGAKHERCQYFFLTLSGALLQRY